MNKNYYTENLDVIKKLHPLLAEWIKNEPDADWVERIEVNNEANLLIKNGSKRTPAYDLDKGKAMIKEQAGVLSIYKQHATILLGMGLGHLCHEIFKKAEKGHHIIVVEPSAHIIRLALTQYNFSKQLESLALTFATTEDDIQMLLHMLDGQLVIENWTYVLEPYTHERPEEYAKIGLFTAHMMNQIMCNTGTVTGAGNKIADNDIVCLPYVIKHRGVNDVKDLFKDKPAIIVSTGPSLRRNIHMLKKAQKKVIIVAVGQALRPLLAYDIRPDFIGAVDFGAVNMEHYNGLLDSDIPLVTVNRSYAPLLEQYQGPKFLSVSPNPGFEDKAQGILKDKGFVEQGGSVAHLCLGFAKQLGCNPIIFVGQDLALTDGLSHIPQADARGKVKVGEGGAITWDVTDPRSSLQDKAGYSMGTDQKVVGYFGGLVSSSTALVSFLTSFETIIEAMPPDVEIINATEGGARIKGTKLMLLSDALKKYCSRKIDKKVLAPYLLPSEDGEALIKKVIPLLKDDLEILDEVISESKLALKTNKLMRTKLGKEQKRKVTRENFQHSVKAQEASLKVPLLSITLYGASRAIHSRTFHVKGETWRQIANSKKDYKTRLERNKFILMAAQAGAESLKESYQKTLRILEGEETPELPVYVPNVDDANRFFEADNFARPLLDAEKILLKYPHDEAARRVRGKALLMREELIKEAEKYQKENREKNNNLLIYNELIEKSLKIGKVEMAKEKDKRDFSEALGCLKKAVDIFPDKMEGLWGYATALHHSDKLTESLTQYNGLVDLFPKELKFKFERALIKMKLEDVKTAITEIEELMSITKEFDSFLPSLSHIYTVEREIEKALDAIERYLKRFPADYAAWDRKGDCLTALGNKGAAEFAHRKAEQIRGKK